MGVGEVQVHYLASPNLNDPWVFVFFPQVEVVDDHLDVGMLHPTYHLQSLGAGIKDVALLTPQRLDSNDDVRAACYFTRHLEEGGNLIPGLLTRKSFRHVAGTGAAPYHDGSPETSAAGQTPLEIFLQSRGGNFGANHFQVRTADKTIEGMAAERRGEHDLGKFAKLIFAHGRDFSRGRFHVVESIFRRTRDVAGADSNLYRARAAPGGAYGGGCTRQECSSCHHE